MTAAVISQAAVGFDYSVLSEADRIFLQRKATELHYLNHAAAQRLIAIGDVLCQVKDRLPHGVFRHWASAEFGWDGSYTTVLMQVFQTFGDLDLDENKVSASALTMLSRRYVPQQAKDEARAVLSQGAPLTLPRAREIVAPHAPDLARRHNSPQGRMADAVQHQAQQLERKIAKVETFTEQVRTAVQNLQVALVEAYGDNLHPQVRRALSQLQDLVKEQQP